jgi:histidine triad (HIT) family protein
MEVSAELAPRIVRGVQARGFNVWTANGREAGQEVFHLHLHILPRFADDAFGLRFPKGYPRQASREELDRVARAITTDR